MRTERRHELHTNVLADWLGVQIDRLRPYSRLVTAVALGVVVLIGVGVYVRSQSTAWQNQQWLEYYRALDMARLENKPEALVAMVNSPSLEQTAVGYWAATGLGDYYLREGLGLLFSNRATATERLRSAITTYGQVAQQTKYPMLAQRALLEMGSAYEGLSDVPEARKSYDKILSTWPGGAFEPMAKQRLADLDRKSTPEFYDWFLAMSPSRGGIQGPGIPGRRPGFGEFPKEGDFLPPLSDRPGKGAPDGTGPKIPSPTFIIPSTTEPPAADTPPAEPPAGDPPVTEPPSDAAPAAPPTGDTPPAGETPAAPDAKEAPQR